MAVPRGIPATLIMMLVLGLSSCRGFQELRIPVAQEALETRVLRFLAAVDTVNPEQLLEFFPRTGELVYLHTTYTRAGLHTSEQRIPAAEIRDALNGFLGRVLSVDQHRQPIGLFAHQVSLRGRDWRPVGNLRFAPPGEGRDARIYLRMRLEEGAWVVAEIADESFRTDALPAWCC